MIKKLEFYFLRGAYNTICAYKYIAVHVHTCLRFTGNTVWYFKWIKLTVHSCWHIGRIITKLKRSKAQLDAQWSLKKMKWNR